MLFSALLLYLPNSKDHIHGASCRSEAALTFRKDVVLIDVIAKAVEQYPCYDFSSN